MIFQPMRWTRHCPILSKPKALFPPLALMGLILLFGCATDGPKKHWEQGRSYYHQDKYKEAEAEFRKAIWLNPEYSEAHFSLGVILWIQGKEAEAWSEFHEAVSLKPKDPQIHENYADRLDRAGRRKEARSYWMEAMKYEQRPDIIERIKKRLAEPD